MTETFHSGNNKQFEYPSHYFLPVLIICQIPLAPVLNRIHNTQSRKCIHENGAGSEAPRKVGVHKNRAVENDHNTSTPRTQPAYSQQIPGLSIRI